MVALLVIVGQLVCDKQWFDDLQSDVRIEVPKSVAGSNVFDKITVKLTISEPLKIKEFVDFPLVRDQFAICNVMGAIQLTFNIS